MYMCVLFRSRRSTCGDPWPQLLIFPEGSTSNGQALMTFKPGAFYPGKPVQPIVLRYPNAVDTTTWTWNQSHGAMSVLWLTLAQLHTNAEMEFLPVYYPSEAEKADAKLYAANVRAVMAAAMGVPTVDFTFEEAKARYGAMYKKRKPKPKLQ
jgi:lysophosphatidylcholine acyltransferase/lyso-PAF acetyltransferase